MTQDDVDKLLKLVHDTNAELDKQRAQRAQRRAEVKRGTILQTLGHEKKEER